MATKEPSTNRTANRRAYPRSPVVVREARYICGMEVFFGYAQNISRSGLFISTAKLREAGDIYEIQFSLPGESTRLFSCKARVVWSRGYRHNSTLPAGFGVEFLDLPEKDAIYIDKWVEAVAQDT
ncbi:MAG: pilus assembly protein PilZ [Deltaproteobacteria bacterium]|nr:MAG: pilus assembly protein PilZ [Deltaproteobacteria bacterium]